MFGFVRFVAKAFMRSGETRPPNIAGTPSSLIAIRGADWIKAVWHSAPVTPARAEVKVRHTATPRCPFSFDMRQPCQWLPDYRLVRQQSRCSIRSGNRIRSAAIAASRVGLNFGARPRRNGQYLASLRSGLWDLVANDYAATYLDASFVDAISA